MNLSPVRYLIKSRRLAGTAAVGISAVVLLVGGTMPASAAGALGLLFEGTANLPAFPCGTAGVTTPTLPPSPAPAGVCASAGSFDGPAVGVTADSDDVLPLTN